MVKKTIAIFQNDTIFYFRNLVNVPLLENLMLRVQSCDHSHAPLQVRAVPVDVSCQTLKRVPFLLNFKAWDGLDLIYDDLSQLLD